MVTQDPIYTYNVSHIHIYIPHTYTNQCIRKSSITIKSFFYRFMIEVFLIFPLFLDFSSSIFFLLNDHILYTYTYTHQKKRAAFSLQTGVNYIVQLYLIRKIYYYENNISNKVICGINELMQVMFHSLYTCIHYGSILYLYIIGYSYSRACTNKYLNCFLINFKTLFYSRRSCSINYREYKI